MLTLPIQISKVCHFRTHGSPHFELELYSIIESTECTRLRRVNKRLLRLRVVRFEAVNLSRPTLRHVENTMLCIRHAYTPFVISDSARVRPDLIRFIIDWGFALERFHFLSSDRTSLAHSNCFLSFESLGRLAFSFSSKGLPRLQLTYSQS